LKLNYGLGCCAFLSPLSPLALPQGKEDPFINLLERFPDSRSIGERERKD